MDDKKILKTHLIFDIDGTLIHESRDVDDDDDEIVAIRRPWIDKLFEKLFQDERVGSVSTWTAASREWSDHVYTNVFEPIIPSGKSMFFRWHSDRCVFKFDKNAIRNGEDPWSSRIVVKPLKKTFRRFKMVGMNQENTVIIDNTPHTFSCNYGNGIHIDTFNINNTQYTDVELQRLWKYLDEKILGKPNIHHIEKRFWKYETYHYL